MSGLETLLTGRTLVKRYRIEEVIGRGGFAAVYRADDERLGRPVAVKVITYPAPDAATREQLRERFQREARAAASMPQHPNVVTVHDFGTDPELGLDFLVMEFLHGENLAAYLDRQGRPPLDLALHILRDTAEGLCIGHRAGLLHRDVKPGNVFLARATGDDPLRVCLLDFGIAHLMEQEGQPERLTKTGFTPHSPAFASPEQLRGEANLTPASDVFSLGVVGYQLLTGEKPFGEKRRRGAEEWTPARGVRELNPEVPVAVEEILRRALAYEPGERFQDAGEMASALDRATGSSAAAIFAAPVAAASVPPSDDHTLLQAPPAEPPPAPPLAAPAQPARRAADQRRGFPAWLAAALVVALAGAAGVWALGLGRGPAPPSTALDPIVTADSVPMEPEPAVRTPIGRNEVTSVETLPSAGTALAPGTEGADTIQMPARSPVESGTAAPPARGDSVGARAPASGSVAAPPAVPAPTPAQTSAPAPADTVTAPRDSVLPSSPPKLLGRPARPDTTPPR